MNREMPKNGAEMAPHSIETSPKVYVVSLARATERRKAISEQLIKYGVDFSFIDAVDAKWVDPAYLRSHVDEAAVLRNVGRRLSAPEIGCALSHRAVYNCIVNKMEPGALIIEDDISATEKFIDVYTFFLDNCHAFRDKKRIYHLGTVGSSYARDVIVRRRTNFQYKIGLSFVALLPNWSSVWGTYGYYITHRAASNLLSMPTIVTVADGWSVFQREGIIEDIYISVPSVVIHPEDCFSGFIEHERDIEMLEAGQSRKPKKRSEMYWAVRQVIKNYFVRPVVERIL